MGCNAIRTSHNPPAPELLDLCDKLGFLVMDEAFDCWGKGKNRQDYHVQFPDWHEADLRALVRRDRNHPSVILWSIGNEVIEQWWADGQEGWKLAARLAGIMREEDRTRPVSAGFNGEISGYNGFQHVLDAIGYNYRINEYARFRQINPTVPLFGAETASALSSRGVYFFPISDNKIDPASRADFQVSSYDLYAAPWATPPDVEWRAADAVPGYAGEFVWTGFDYLGEPTPYNADLTNLLNFSDPAEKERQKKQLEELGRIPTPSRSSYFGIVDLAGFPKDRYYFYQARWRPDLPMPSSGSTVSRSAARNSRRANTGCAGTT
jgi:beta-galactosidase